MDIETYRDEDGVIVPYCICAKMGNLEFNVYGLEDIFESFFEKICEFSVDDKVTVYTHNINFDGVVLLDSVKNKNILFDLFIRDSNIYWIKIWYLKTEILFRCSYKIIPISVSKMGKFINSPKQIFPYKFISFKTINYIGSVPSSELFNNSNEYNLFCQENSFLDVKAKTIEYCMQDVYIVFRVLYEVLNIISEISSKKIIDTTFSFSSISYKIFSIKYDFFKISNIKNTAFEHEYFRNAYYGGRCEVFGNPSGKIVHYFDFTGMYSQCMMEKFPIGKAVLKKSNLCLSDVGFHTVKYRCDDYLPFLPFKRGKLIFPNGEITGTFWFEEIQNAVKYGKCQLLEHYSSYVYEAQEYVFKEYVESFIDLRKKGLYYDILGKNMNNGLYGSFGLNEESGDFVVCRSDSEFDSYQKYADIISFKKIGPIYLLEIAKNSRSIPILDKKKKWDIEHKKRNLAYAAIIASKARIKLCNNLQAVVDDGGDLYYTDTDSIFAGYDDDRVGKTLMDIKWLRSYEDAVFISSKFYFLKGDALKLKGINFHSYDYSYIKKSFYDDVSNVIFNDQLAFRKKDFVMSQSYSSKNISFKSYDKRLFYDGKTKTRPVSINTVL